MKNYNIFNYKRYLHDLEECKKRHDGLDVMSYQPVSEDIIEALSGPDKTEAIREIRLANDKKRNGLIEKFLPYAEMLSKKFSRTDQAIGILSIEDLIQEACVGLIESVDLLDWKLLEEAEDPLQRLQSRLAKQIKGRIRRSIDEKATPIRLPENHITAARRAIKLGEINDPFVVNYYNAFFVSLDEAIDSNTGENWMDIPDSGNPYLNEFHRKCILSIMRDYLEPIEYDVLRLSYGLSGMPYMASIDISKHKTVLLNLNSVQGVFGDSTEILKSLAISKELKVSLKNEWTNIQTINNIKRNAIKKLKGKTPYDRLQFLIEA